MNKSGLAMKNLEKSNTVAVVGGGSWGTALGALLAGKGYAVQILLRDAEVAKAINARHENSRYLPGFALPPNLKASCEADKVLPQANLIVWAVPCQASRKALRELKAFLPPRPLLVSATKGIEAERLQTVEAIVFEEIVALEPRYAVLSGPSFAEEVLKNMPTAVVLSCRDEDLGRHLQQVFSTHLFRAYASSDVTGVELGGAVKNVIAIAAGLVDGLGLGHNTKAALITRGLAEISRLGVALGASEKTFMGLSGLGDLVLTCTGDLSRNRHVGFCLGQGQKLSDIFAAMRSVAEGVRTSEGVKNLARQKNVEMPITEAVCAVLAEKLPPARAIETLMGRELKTES